MAMKRKPVRKTRQAEPANARALRAALDALPVGFALFDAGGRLAAWNARLANLKLLPKRLLKQGTAMSALRANDAGLQRRVSRPRELQLPQGVTLRVTTSRVPPGHLLVTYEDITAQKRVETELGRARAEANEALERQTATAEILKVISSSPTEVQPVFDAVADSSMRLLGALSGTVTLRAGEALHLAAFTSTSPSGDDALRKFFPVSLLDDRDKILAQAALSGAPVHIRDTEDAHPSSTLREIARRRGYRSILAVPMLNKGSAIGTLSVTRREAGKFSDHDIELLTTFADQAVIAIENVRLFNETKEALERQTATAEILKVISSSPSDIQPVLDAVAENAARLCQATDAIIQLKEGDRLRWVAHYGNIPNLPRDSTRTITREIVTGRAVLEGRQIHVHDLQAESVDYPLGSAIAREFGYHTLLATPLMREGTAIGSIMIRHAEMRPFSDKHLALVRTFADQAVIAIENARLFNETKEALERQTATAEILRVISGSPTDIQPVLDAVAERAAQLCAAKDAHIWRRDGNALEVVADYGGLPVRRPRLTISRLSVIGRAVADGEPVHVLDLPAVFDTDFPDSRAMMEGGFRTVLGIPLLREGTAIGAILIRRTEVSPFSDKQIALLKTFADQAVIAIENVRLFNETREALERQTATAEILKVISGSPTDTQPVFDAIAKSALRLIGGRSAVVVRRVGDALHLSALTATSNSGDEALRKTFPTPLTGQGPIGKAILSGKAVYLRDVESETSLSASLRETARARGTRSILTVPMIREQESIGGISVTRDFVGPFTDHQITLLKTFADQAVIAIENVRLFNETREALERQTATAEILKVISGSPTDVQPVFDTIVRNAVELSDALFSAVYRFDGERLHLVAHHNYTPEVLALEHSLYPMRPERGQAVGRAILERRLIHIQDALTDADYQHDIAQSGGWRSMIAVPMFRDQTPVGVIWVARAQTGPFSTHQIELLESFADQAVIAIENVRLFNETREALEQQTATAEILKVISESPTDVQPVLDAIAATALELFGGASIGVALVRGDKIELPAAVGLDDAHLRALRDSFPRPLDLDSSVNEVVVGGVMVHHPDLEAPDLPAYTRNVATSGSIRAMLGVPLLREGKSIGGIFLSRTFAGAYTDKQISLLKIFADQAVIAIENVRLFNATRESLERQTATAEILKVISESPTDVQPVFDAIVRSANALCGGTFAVLYRFDGESIRIAADAYMSPEHGAALRATYPRHIDALPDHLVSRALVERRAQRLEDPASNPAHSDTPFFRAFPYGSALVVPMLNDGLPIGAIAVGRMKIQPFSQREESLLQTFLDQAVIAIENVRLFNETKEALEQQTATSEVLKAISRSTFDLNAVLQVLIENATRLAGASKGFIFRFDGEIARMAYSYNAPPAYAALMEATPIPPGRGSLVGRTLRERGPVHIQDALADKEFTLHEAQRLGGFRSMLGVPMIREGNLIGVIAMWRAEVKPFTERQIELVSTFADQAVIAIENVRLFNETTEALEWQTATAEILKVISSSPTNVQPVFDAIVASAKRLFSAKSAVLLLRGESHFSVGAYDGPEIADLPEQVREAPLDRRENFPSRAILDGAVVHIPNWDGDDIPEHERIVGKAFGIRAGLMVPLLRDGVGIGAIAVTRETAGAYADKEITLLQSFADQAVIAIENVRLFNELQSRTEALTRSVGQLTALGEVGQAISSTLDLETVLKTIVSHAMRLTGLDAGVIYEFDVATERFQLRASENFDDESVANLRGAELRVGEGAVGTSVSARAPQQVPDTHAPEYPARLRALLDRPGFRAALAVPLLREEQIIGALLMLRRTPGPFADDIVDMLKTFASQSALAIQNARLFREIEDKGRQLEEASQHKSQFLASMSHELRTPLNAILGFNEMILGEVYGEVPTDMKEPLDDIQTSGKHLLRLINNVLDLAKIEAGRMELSLADYAVQDMVESVRATLRPLAEAKGLEFLASVPNDVPLAYGDFGRLTQCLMNLAGNSLKFTKSGSVGISVEQNGATLIFRVADTGIGIPVDKIDSLFTEFKQTDASIASEYGGTGLGLSITKQFIEMHGGRIWVESELGQGSTFIFELPLRVDAGATA